MKLARVLGLCLVALLAGQLSAAEKPDTQFVRSRIPREPVDSSGLAAVGYSKRLQVLEIEFVNGAIYRYEDVPAPLYRAMVVSESKGRFYHDNIRGRFRSRHVRPAKSAAAIR